MSANGDPLYAGYGLTKWFGGLRAVHDLSVELFAGQVLALVGDNGAGKSTTLKMLAGSLRPDAGSITLEGEHVRLASPRTARALGIETVYQDLALADTLEVVQNVFSGRELTRYGFLQRVEMTKQTESLLEEFRVKIPSVFAQISSLSGGQRQGCAISRAVSGGSRVLLLDEPTAALGVAERRNVLELIKSLRDAGIGILIISHNLPDVFEVADRITVLRRGERVGTVPATDVDAGDLVAMITGASGNAAAGDS
ncbi:MAG: ATP-binding cassette domain-containing protein [bacterium]|nr:ATP-binding cassette domain-containing protein [bacterium]MCY3951144.1 ATP-binding cassette domain-containing protein [bacterium]MCY4103747.1 ATP-binding cassette domain-containing protein [bacterium]